MDLPELARDASEAAESKARNLIPWLPSPYTCDDCSTLCEADVVFDYRMYEPTEAWTCPECEQSFYREEPWHDA